MQRIPPLWEITTHEIQEHMILSPTQDKSAVRRTHQSVCAGDLVKGIGTFRILAGVMYQNEGQIAFVGKLFEGQHILIVRCITVSIVVVGSGSHQRVNDDQSSLRVIRHKLLKRSHQTPALTFFFKYQMHIFSWPVYTEHLAHPLLQAKVGILQCKVQHCRLLGVILQKSLTLGDTPAQLRHKKRLSDLRRACQDVGSGWQEAVHHLSARLQRHVHQFSCRNAVQRLFVIHHSSLPVRLRFLSALGIPGFVLVCNM